MSTNTVLLTEADVATMLGVHPHTVANMRRAGVGPRYTQLPTGNRLVRYDPRDVQEWMQRHTTDTADT